MKKVLIIQNKRIGDVLISSVIANNFKAQFPDSEIHFLAYDFTHGVIENNPNIDRIISINDKELKKLKTFLNSLKKSVKNDMILFSIHIQNFKAVLLVNSLKPSKL